MASVVEKDLRELRNRNKKPNPQHQPQVLPPHKQYTEPTPKQPMTRRFDNMSRQGQAAAKPYIDKSYVRPSYVKPTEAKVNKQEVACFTCGGPHFAKECPKKPTPTVAKGQVQAKPIDKRGPTVAAAQPQVKKEEKIKDAGTPSQNF